MDKIKKNNKILIKQIFLKNLFFYTENINYCKVINKY